MARIALFLLISSIWANEVIVITDHSFYDHVHHSPDLWLLDFYAPWCGHCQHLEPILNDLAEKTHGKLRIGKIDTTSNPELKEKFGIKSFPTLKFSRGDSIREYRGGRELKDFVKFVERMHAEPVQKINSVEELEKAVETNGLVFLLALKTPDAAIYNTYLSIAQQFQDTDVFLTSQNPQVLNYMRKEQPPYLVKLHKTEEPVLYPSIGSMTADTLQRWVELNRFPLVVELSGKNFHDTASHGRKLVMGCSNLADIEKHKELVDLLYSVAKKSSTVLEPRVYDQFVFGWLDGNQYESFVSRFFVYPETLPKIVVLDSPNERFYEREEPITDLAEFLNAIAQGKEPEYYQGWYGLRTKAHRMFKRWYPYSCLAILPMVLVIYMIYACCGAQLNTDKHKKTQ